MTTTTPAPGPEEYAYDVDPVLIQTPTPDFAKNGGPWTWSPMWHRACSFGPDEFDAVMQNLVRNPNVLSSWLFRADIVAETTLSAAALPSSPPAFPLFRRFGRTDDRTVVRRLIPRNTLRDKPMLQTCLFYESASGNDEDEHSGCDGHHASQEASEADTEDGPVHRSLVVYLPHATTPADVPFYHPKVQGVGFLHEWQPMTGAGTVSMHFSFFPNSSSNGADPGLEEKLSRPVLSRVALNLINTVCKHGEGRRSGYVKRVHHDQLVPQAHVQDRYTRLKEKYARRLVGTWQETTDPAKHVFEDLSISAFLIELWADMYGDGRKDVVNGDLDKIPPMFPGFIDVGCGNGLLVHILNEEGYKGWGFDARKRRSWQQYGSGESTDLGEAGKATLPLRECLLLPSFLLGEGAEGAPEAKQTGMPDNLAIHDGRFPPGMFLIANHADELTVWAPLLAALSNCTFLAIPCCSHNFTGAKFRAPPPSSAAKEATSSVSVTLASSSTYASFVEWVVNIAEDCGWKVEFEMLRIPSTRNVGLIGRSRRSADGTPASNFTIEQAWDVITKYGGAYGFADNVAKLAAEGKKSSH